MTRENLQIRRATSEDAAELARLRYGFRTERRLPTEAAPAFIGRCHAWMSARLAPDAAWRCWVAAVRSELVGTLWLQLIEKLPNPADERELHGYISSVYVVPSRRNAGIGTALLTACLGECDAWGLDALFLWSTPDSRRLYQRHGFALRDDLLDRRLQGGPGPGIENGERKLPFTVDHS
ncbi:MAG: GNAT family N-acetyltransferase [Gemmatimonadales bacterium]